MVEWVSERQAEDLKLDQKAVRPERCMFCAKEFNTHNSFTAHLRWHSEQIDEMVYRTISRSGGPVRVATIQNLTHVNFSIKNAVQRLVRSGKIYRTPQGFATRMIVPKAAEPKPKKVNSAPKISEEVPMKNALSEDRMNRLIVATLKKLQPEVYNDITNEIAENMYRYAMSMAEIS